MALPDASALDLVRYIRKSVSRQVPIVVTSGATAGYHQGKTLEAGADVFLGKPVSVDELIKAISNVLQASAVPQSTIPQPPVPSSAPVTGQPQPPKPLQAQSAVPPKPAQPPAQPGVQVQPPKPAQPSAQPGAQVQPPKPTQTPE
jgi:DNA-binding response OmpR family regulator